MRRFLTTGLILLVASCGSGTDNNGNNPQVPAHDVAIQKNSQNLGSTAFSPANKTISLATATTVKWYNADITGTGSYGGTTGVTHQMVSDDGTTFASGQIQPGGVFTATIAAPGTYTYHCAIHQTMTGTITVNP